MGTIPVDKFATEVNPYVTEPDVQLMCRVREGDIYAFSLLVNRYRKPLISFLRRTVSNRFEAEELAQEVFLRVYRSRESYQPAARFTTWLFRIASHTAINWLRDRRNGQCQESLENPVNQTGPRQYTDNKPTVEQFLLADVRAQEIRYAIDCLPATQREAVIMHKYRELEYWQIARELRCSEGAVKSLLYRAYERLRRSLAHFAGERR